MRRLLSLFALSLLLGVTTACGDKDDTDAVEGDTDTDADTDTDTDADADTDADTDVALYGPDNAWWHAFASDVPDGLAGTGWRPGDTAYNFTLIDQNGDEVELYQFYGRTVLLDLFAYW